MKKIYFSFVLLMASSLSLFAQDIILSDPLGLIDNTTVRVVNGDMWIPLEQKIYVKNNSTSPMEIMMKKVIIDTIPGSMNYFCWASSCYPSTTYESPSGTVIQPGVTNTVDGSAHYDAQGHIGISKIRYVLFKNHATEDSASLTVYWNAGYVGIDETLPFGIRFSPAYPNPATNQVSFTYNFPSGTLLPAKVQLTNLLGEVVKTVNIDDNQGKLVLPLDNLHSGIYFYSLLVKEQSLITRKLIVR
ncbi:MAG: T9SS type A sorting domain-containing protein [Bacteroidetes bacterium]|nr:T9SS type A sorting domain-containing protein [Bacteroidota bacterium]